MTSRRHLVHIWCKHFAPDSVCRRCRRSHQWNLQFLSCTRLKIWRGLPTPFQILKVVRTHTRPDEVLFSAFRFDGLIPWSQWTRRCNSGARLVIVFRMWSAVWCTCSKFWCKAIWQKSGVIKRTPESYGKSPTWNFLECKQVIFTFILTEVIHLYFPKISYFQKSFWNSFMATSTTTFLFQVLASTSNGPWKYCPVRGNSSRDGIIINVRDFIEASPGQQRAVCRTFKYFIWARGGSHPPLPHKYHSRHNGQRTQSQTQQRKRDPTPGVSIVGRRESGFDKMLIR